MVQKNFALSHIPHHQNPYTPSNPLYVSKPLRTFSHSPSHPPNQNPYTPSNPLYGSKPLHNSFQSPHHIPHHTLLINILICPQTPYMVQNHFTLSHNSPLINPLTSTNHQHPYMPLNPLYGSKKTPPPNQNR